MAIGSENPEKFIEEMEKLAKTPLVECYKISKKEYPRVIKSGTERIYRVDCPICYASIEYKMENVIDDGIIFCPDCKSEIKVDLL